MPSRKAAPGRLGANSLRLPALAIEASLTSRAYDILREAIAEMPIYDGASDDIRLDERALAERATDAEIAEMLVRFPAFRPGGEIPDHDTPISEYSAVNVEFHQRIVDLAHSELFSSHLARLRIHMRAIRQRTIGDDDRRIHSVVDHAEIVAALCNRDADRAEALVRRHAVGLAEHVRDNVSYLS